MSIFAIGQRWFSEAEPELGLGIIEKVENKTLMVNFTTAIETRTYGLKTAPLKRMVFEVGETFETIEGQKVTITQIKEQNNILFYFDQQENIIPEMQIKGDLNLSHPQDKLFAGTYDKNELFNLRYQSILYKRNYQKFKFKGLLGARINLLAHQCSILYTLNKRIYPRVLLADEVGLGKTIEAATILSSLIQQNRVHRTLILVPDSLVYQWYFELLQKFNLHFKVMSENDELDIEAQSIQEGEHYIVSFKKLSAQKELKEQILQQSWDMLIIDEAHQIQWSPEKSSEEYDFIESLSKQIHSLILLSATPEMLGLEGHFSRLKLLDPDQFYNFEQFKKQQKKYKDQLPVIKDIIAGNSRPAQLEKYFTPEEIHSFKNQEDIVEALIDRHGTGRIFIRNTREHLEKFNLFFPKRISCPIPIKIQGQINDKIVFNKKLNKLIEIIENNKDQKILLLAHSKQLILKLSKKIKENLSIKLATFHSGQSLMERDRQAAYFAQKDGASILLCTEIGSEGRNFEFAHHLFLFDLPKVPEQLEQRIGRLDRIGQTKNIQIHIPYIKSSFEEILFRWYDEVLHSFDHSPKGVTVFYRKHHQELISLLENPYNQSQLDKFIDWAKKKYETLCEQLAQGHDYLLDLNSFNLNHAQMVMKQTQDFPSNITDYLLQIANAVGLEIEELNDYSYFIKPADNMFIPSYPSLPVDGFSFTASRKMALIKDDIQFLSWEHPLVLGSIDLFTNSQIGNMTVTTHEGKLNNHILFELIFNLEAVKSSHSDSTYFLPATPIRILLDAKANNLTTKYPKKHLDQLISDIKTPQQKELISQLPKGAVKELIQQAQKQISSRIIKYQNQAINECSEYCDHEIYRLKTLKEKNPLIKQKNLDQWIEYKESTLKQIKSAKVALDSFRLIIP